MAQNLVYLTLQGCESQTQDEYESFSTELLRATPGSQNPTTKHYQVVSESRALSKPYLSMYYHCAVLIDTKHILVFGGISAENSLLPMNVVHTLRLNHSSPACKAQWLPPYRTIHTKPVPRFQATLTADDSSDLYLVGGQKSDLDIASTTFVYNSSKNSWKPIETTTKSRTKRGKLESLGPRYSHVAVFRARTKFSGRTNRGQIIVHGGFDSNAANTEPRSDLHIFDIYSKKWSVVPHSKKWTTPAPALAEHAGVLLENRWFVLFGGRDENNVMRGEVFVFDMHRMEWSRPQFRDGDVKPEGRIGHMMVESLSKKKDSLECIVFGGVLSQGDIDEVYTNEVLRLVLVRDESTSSQREISEVAVERVRVSSVFESQTEDFGEDADSNAPKMAHGSIVPWKEEKAYVVIGGFGEDGAIRKPFMLKVHDNACEKELKNAGKKSALESNAEDAADVKIVEPSENQNTCAEDNKAPFIAYSSPLHEYLASVSHDPTEGSKGFSSLKNTKLDSSLVGSKRTRELEVENEGGSERQRLSSATKKPRPNVEKVADDIGPSPSEPTTPDNQIKTRSLNRIDYSEEAKPLGNNTSQIFIQESAGSSVRLDPKERVRMAQRMAQEAKELRAKEQAEKRKKKREQTAKAARGRGKQRATRGRGRSGTRGGRKRTIAKVAEQTDADATSDGGETVSEADYAFALERLEKTEEEIQERDDTIEKQKKEIDELLRSVKEYRRDNMKLRTLCSRATSQPSDPVDAGDRPSSGSDVPQLRAQAMHLEGVRVDLAEELDEKKRLLKESDEIISEKEQEIKTLEIEVSKLKGKTKKLHDQLKASTKEAREAKKSQEDTVQEARKFSAEKNKNETNLISAQKHGESLEKSLATAKDTITELEEDVTALTLKTADFEKQNKQLSEQYANLTCENDQITKEKEALGKQYEELESKLGDLQKKVTELQNHERALQGERNLAETSKKDLERRALVAEKNLISTQAEVLTLTRQHSTSSREAKQSKRRQDAAEKEAVEMRHVVKSMYESLQQQLQQVTRLFEPTMTGMRNLVLNSPSTSASLARSHRNDNVSAREMSPNDRQVQAGTELANAANQSDRGTNPDINSKQNIDTVTPKNSSVLVSPTGDLPLPQRPMTGGKAEEVGDVILPRPLATGNKDKETSDQIQELGNNQRAQAKPPEDGKDEGPGPKSGVSGGVEEGRGEGVDNKLQTGTTQTDTEEDLIGTVAKDLLDIVPAMPPEE